VRENKLRARQENALMDFALLMLVAVGLPIYVFVNWWIGRVRGVTERGFPHSTDGGPPTVYRRPTSAPSTPEGEPTT
jgi:hypothetical protein